MPPPPPDADGRRPLKTRDVVFFQKLAAALARAGVSANAISFSSIVFSFIAAALFAATPHADEWRLRALWFGAALFIQLRLLANMLDGMVAVEGGKGGPTGDLWNEAPDRLADSAILIGAGYAAGSDPLLGFGAALMAVFIAYIRALGASVGAGQVFLGPQAKPHRMAVLTVACVIAAFVPFFIEPIGSRTLSPVSLALWVVVVGGAVTVLRRLAVIARFLRNRSR